jgi:clan AA aspartic protease
MGRIVVKVKVENLAEILLAERGLHPADQVKSIELEALVDTGATLLCLTPKDIEKIGLSLFTTRTAMTANGTVECKIFQGARLTILGRMCTADVMEVPEGTPSLVGYFPLENLDLVVDPKQQAVTPNPAHGGRMVMDLYLTSSRTASHSMPCSPRSP